ncbi:AMP-binding protein [Gordonia sp. TBRC 11910]|uniref:AMP-binding protein n=1 Tax=Gordonia asplenii TaxID=2725283 RepID=A0A848L879_9ACTN|nr:AMP-binding protein [Gordonia asplenii]NMO04681.1 AMP-binding protein [Gordonia asplenii]
MTPTTSRPSWWQDLTAPTFTWSVPDRFNIATACTDDQRREDLALIVDTGIRIDRYTFGDLTALSRRFASALTSTLGLTAGDRIGIMVPQGVEVLTAHLGGFRAGVVTVPLSVKFGSDAVAHRLADSGARVLVIDSESYSRVHAGLADLPSLHTVLVVGERAADGNARFDLQTFDEVVAAADESRTAAITTAASPAIIIYTSGTTGPPKGALHGHRILPAHMPGVRIAFDDAPTPDDIFWTPADWAWIGGLFDVLFPALAMGRPVVACPDKFTATRALQIMAEHAVTASFVPPTALKQMRRDGVDAATAGRVRLRSLATGGEPLGEALRSWVQTIFGVAINEFYGQTEMNMTIGTARSKWIAPPGSMGRPFPGFTVALLDSLGEPQAVGQVGEICVRADNPGQFIEYWNRPEHTAEKRHGGWIHTGDLGTRDDDGNYFYQGRADDVISSAGYRIGPGEIEETLLTHPAVAMAGVIGAPDELRGEAVHAFVVLNNGIHGTDELRTELQTYVKSRLAFYQYPRQITIVDELPLTATGKILRRELRLRAEERADPAIGT